MRISSFLQNTLVINGISDKSSAFFKAFIFSTFVLGIFSNVSAQTLEQEVKGGMRFIPGEKLSFALKYGWFTMGKGDITLDKTTQTVDGQEYYVTHIDARTAGLARLFDGIDDHYVGLINTENYRPLTSEKHIHHKRGEWHQWNEFDYENLTVDVRGQKWKKDYVENWEVEITENTLDILGTYMFVRGIDWSKYQEGDSVMLKAFFEEKIYDFGFEHGGTEVVEFKGHQYTAQKIYGLFPPSKTFPDERSVVGWVINYDGVNLPVKLEAQIKFGKVKVELIGFSIGNLVIYEDD